MSYARWGVEGSSVYVFATSGGHIECCGCSLNPRSVRFTTTAQMIDHLLEHRAAGDTVPASTIASLRVDRAENDSTGAEIRAAEAEEAAK